MRHSNHQFEPGPVPQPWDVLTEDIRLRLARRWAEPCEAAFAFLVEQRPRELAHLIESGTLEPGDLTFAAEALGRHRDGALVRRVLLPLLESPEAVVREGAIYGLCRHLDEASRCRLRRVAETDGSETVRTAADETLGE